MECIGSELDRSGELGISQEKADQFFCRIAGFF